jgi:hypothetical protein
VVHEGMGLAQGDRIVFGVAFERGQGGFRTLLGQHRVQGLFIAARLAFGRGFPALLGRCRGQSLRCCEALNTKRTPRGAGSLRIACS